MTLITPLVCEHLRTRANCEDCALVRAQQRGHGAPVPEPVAVPDEVELADYTLLIEVGPDHFVQIMAGYPVPARLAHLPRQPRDGEPPKKPTARKRTPTAAPTLHT